MKPILKRILCVALPVIMVMTILTGCPPTHIKEFSCGELIDFYEEKGYSVAHTEYPEPEDGCGCSVEIQEEDGKYILFRFYDSPNKAQDYADTRELPLLVRIICSIFGIQPSRTVDTHSQAAYEYNSQTLSDLFDQFTVIPPYVRDSFFSQDYLENFHLADMPVPKLENSRLIAPYYHDSEWVYYGNLTREEFDAYVLSVVEYLKSREDIYYPCYYYDDQPQQGNDYTTFGETYDTAANQHRFAFSMEPELAGTELIHPITIEIEWVENDRGDMNFTSNAMIRFYDNQWRTSYNPCAAEHSYDEGIVYPVPGMNWSITVRACIYCDAATQSGYLDSTKEFAVTVAQGRSYILSNNWNDTAAWDIDSMYAGLTLEITTQPGLTLLVNGESIPVLRADENTQTFGFIMPENDVTIEIFPAETE